MAQIVITNVTQVTPTQYSVEFIDDFNMTDLFYEISLDGTNWQAPVSLSTFTSPQIISVPNVINFNLRLSSNYTAPIPPESGFLMINSNDKFLINDTDSLKYTN